MLSKINSTGLQGIDGYIIEAEGDVALGLPSFDIVGLPDAAVKESKERVRSAISNCGFDFPLRRVTINLAPGNIKKEGSGFDLPIAMAVLIASNQLEAAVDEYIFLGELALGGELRPVPGILPMAMAAKAAGFKKVILPLENAREAAIVQDIEVFGAVDLHSIIGHLTKTAVIEKTITNIEEIFLSNLEYEMDFQDVKGQNNAKRALEIAAAGGHNCIMIGTPGSGKTMLAQRLPSILPKLHFEEALEVTKIHSIAGILPKKIPLVTTRPFRSPHHTVSTISLTGGGKMPRPGEISLAHNGVLFLDELPEFKKEAIEVLRQPLEEGTVTVSRVQASITYPCTFMLVAAMNPCKCGYLGDPKRGCTCSITQVQKYLSRISGPLLDRIDMHIEVPPVGYSSLSGQEKPESSAKIRERVNKARKIQLERYKQIGVYSNSQLKATHLSRFCALGEDEKALIKAAFDKLGLSARAYSRIIKVSRTIADLSGSENIKAEHLAEAIGYRSLDRKYW